MDQIENSERDLVKSAARSLDILEFLSNHSGGVTLTELRQHLKIPISSLYNIMMTLVQKGYVVRDELTLMYRLGPKVGQLAASYHNQVDLIQVADPYMNWLNRLTGETTSLTVLRDDVVVFIHKAVSDSNLQVVNPVGTTLAAHATGSGKVMLAYLPEGEFERIYPKEHLQKLTPNTITSKKKLKMLLPEIAANGYAFDNEESTTGIWAVAACIHDRLGSPLAALSVVGLIGRVQNKNYQSWPQQIKETSDEISAALGYRLEKTEGRA
jgi:DNA-binding IclR family transcriptional regulator